MSDETPEPDVRHMTADVGKAISEGRREAALLKTGALQNAILNSANFSSIATDEKGVIQLFNVGAERMLGYAADDVVNRISPADISDPQELIARARSLSVEIGTPITPGFEALVFKASRGIEDIYELTYIRKDGSRFPAVVSVTALRDEHDAIIGYLLIGTDNTARMEIETERKRLDQALQEKNVELEAARALAEKANLAKSDFLSSMSHELRSPLNAILGFAQLMESEEPPLPPARKESVAQILQAGWHLLTLINEILDLATVESGHVPLSLEPVSLADVILECRGMIEPQAQQRGIRMSFPLIANPLHVMADRTRLKQVLINLLSNAIKYNVEEGTVEVACIEIPPKRVRIAIRDSGPGMSPEQVAQLFQAFNRLGQEAGGEEGTGIGLVVARRLVELMGGAIGVESAVGSGSVFWFEFDTVAPPRIPTAGSGAGEPVKRLVPLGTREHRLLYVEDNPANMKLVEQIIARHPDIRLLTAMTGYSGIEIARESRPDVILMDINLPDINGFDALDVLRSEPDTARIPVIAISANAMPQDIERGMKAGFFRYITKPIKVDEFMEAMGVALEFAGTSTAPDDGHGGT
ncbi:MAG TPA: ATP-binding protein, partial [Candidatus Deferrimicrobiaceae bacterium]